LTVELILTELHSSLRIIGIKGRQLIRVAPHTRLNITLELVVDCLVCVEDVLDVGHGVLVGVVDLVQVQNVRLLALVALRRLEPLWVRIRLNVHLLLVLLQYRQRIRQRELRIPHWNVNLVILLFLHVESSVFNSCNSLGSFWIFRFYFQDLLVRN